MFPASGTEQQFVVPDGVTSIDVDAYGGRGGGTSVSPASTRVEVTGRLSVTPGATLYINVGGDGAPPAGQWRTAAGGSNGGADGVGGGGGGGGTDLRLVSRSTADGESVSLRSRVLVAAGRGGTDAFGQSYNRALSATPSAPGGNGTPGYGGKPADGRYAGGGGGGLYGGGGADYDPDAQLWAGGDGSSLAPTGGTINTEWRATTPPSSMTISWTTKTVAKFVLSSSVDSVPTGQAPTLTVSLPYGFTADVGFYCLDLPGDYKGFGVVKPNAARAVLQVDPALWSKLGPGPHEIYAQSDGDAKYAMVFSNKITVKADG